MPNVPHGTYVRDLFVRRDGELCGLAAWWGPNDSKHEARGDFRKCQTKNTLADAWVSCLDYPGTKQKTRLGGSDSLPDDKVPHVYCDSIGVIITITSWNLTPDYGHIQTKHKYLVDQISIL